jgi:putative transposase
MPRTARSIRAGLCYHVINRGNARTTVFHDALDYAAFMALARESARRTSTEVLAFCLMPNHFHFVLRPSIDEGLSKWAHWLLTSHVQRFKRRYCYVGRIWQGRYKAFPVQQDAHLFTVMRYVERNALRAGLVANAEDWPWGSLALRARGRSEDGLIAEPLGLPLQWVSIVNVAQYADELERIRDAVNRGAPYGNEDWARACATDLDIEHTLRSRGRPRRPSVAESD